MAFHRQHESAEGRLLMFLDGRILYNAIYTFFFDKLFSYSFALLHFANYHANCINGLVFKSPLARSMCKSASQSYIQVHLYRVLYTKSRPRLEIQYTYIPVLMRLQKSMYQLYIALTLCFHLSSVCILVVCQSFSFHCLEVGDSRYSSKSRQTGSDCAIRVLLQSLSSLDYNMCTLYTYQQIAPSSNLIILMPQIMKLFSKGGIYLFFYFSYVKYIHMYLQLWCV